MTLYYKVQDLISILYDTYLVKYFVFYLNIKFISRHKPEKVNIRYWLDQ